jgi:hypothetical protein
MLYESTRRQKNLLLSFTLLYHQRQLLLSNHCILSILGFSGFLPRRHTLGVSTSEHASAVFFLFLTAWMAKQD